MRNFADGTTTVRHDDDRAMSVGSKGHVDDGATPVRHVDDGTTTMRHVDDRAMSVGSEGSVFAMVP